MAAQRILIVEDDGALAEVVNYNLQQQGYEVHVAHDGMDGLKVARRSPPDLVVLDLMLPVIDGLEVCRRLRADVATRDVPILMLTAKAEETDEVVGFSVGADDYVTKPFSTRVLIQRVKALLRRSDQHQNQDTAVISSQGIVIDRLRHVASIDGTALTLTRTEFDLLETLVRQPGRAFSRAELIQAAMGDDAYILDRTVDVHVRAIRTKLADRADVVETVRGVGYRFRDDGS